MTPEQQLKITYTMLKDWYQEMLESDENSYTILQHLKTIIKNVDDYYAVNKE